MALSWFYAQQRTRMKKIYNIYDFFLINFVQYLFQRNSVAALLTTFNESVEFNESCWGSLSNEEKEENKLWIEWRYWKWKQ